MSTFRTIGAFAIGITLWFQQHASLAQSFPSRPIAMVVPFPPGPGIDAVARILGKAVSSDLGQPVIIENRSGAGGRIASEYVARAAPDGYTLLVATTSSHVASVYLTKHLQYDPVKDFTPILLFADAIKCIVVNQASLPVNSVDELIKYAKEHPGKVTYGSSGVGSSFHLSGELFSHTFGVQLTHVPYRGGVAAVTDLLADHIDMSFTALSQVLAVMGGSKTLKILALLDQTRFSATPDLPSITEKFPSYKMPSDWNGIEGPAGMPPDVVQRLRKAFQTALATPDIRTRIEALGYRLVDAPGDEFARRIRQDIKDYKSLIEIAHIEPQ